MNRFFCPSLSDVQASGLAFSRPGPQPLTVHLDPDETHHARHVLRLELGQKVELFDGRGQLAVGTLVTWESEAASDDRRRSKPRRPAGRAVVRLDELRQVPPPRPRIDVAAAFPKGSHADEMVAGLSQLGVGGLFPLRTSRSVVDPRQTRIERFGRAVVESAKQCGRAYLMEIGSPLTLEAALTLDHDLRLIAKPGAPREAADQATKADATRSVAERLRAAQRVLIFIGPEGGWSDEELSLAAAHSSLAWSLGPHIMRIEIAALAAAALAGYLACEGG